MSATLEKNMVIEGPLWPEPVRVLSVDHFGTMLQVFSLSCAFNRLSSPRQFAQTKGAAMRWARRDIALMPQPGNISSWARM